MSRPAKARCRPGIPGGHYWLATGTVKGQHGLYECQQCGDICWLAITWEQLQADQSRNRKGLRFGRDLYRVGKAPVGKDYDGWTAPRDSRERKHISLAVLGPPKG